MPDRGFLLPALLRQGFNNKPLCAHAYMLLDASSQRAKSWSCEHCRNWTELLEEDTCRACYWAFPESYTHVAMVEVRRVDLQWDGAEVAVYDRLLVVLVLAMTSMTEQRQPK